MPERSHDDVATSPSRALPDQHARLADGAVPRPGPAGDARRHSRRRARSPGRDGLRLGLAAERLADRAGRRSGSRAPIPSGAASSRRRCPTCATTTSPARGSRSPATRCIAASAATRRWPGCASACATRGLRLMLDFVPNHTAPRSSLGRGPSRVLHPRHRGRPGPRAAELHLGQADAGDLLLAYGRDPYFSGWPDTLQLNYANPATQEAMIGELLKIAGQCDGVRCDMAMLVLPDVFERTWGRRPRAVLAAARPRRVRERGPGLLLHGRGVLGPGVDAAAAGLRLRLRQAALRPPARADTPGRCASTFTPGSTTRTSSPAFLENHDEPRAAATLPPGVHEAAAVITFLSPGPALLPPGPVRGPEEAHLAAPGARAARAADQARRQFYDRLLTVLRQPSRPRRRVAAARVRAGLGRQLDVGLLHRLLLGSPDERAAARRRQLRRQPEPVLRPPAVPGPRRPRGAAHRPDRVPPATTATAATSCHAGCISTCRPGAIMCSR